MSSDATKYDEIIIKGILQNNQFEIKEVKELKGLWAGYFKEGRLKEFEGLINAGDESAIEKLPHDGIRELGYIDVSKFKDQTGQDYFVLVYEGSEYLEDPEIVQIYKV